MDPTIKDFETAIAELETIVKKLEEGDLALEASLQLYERGVHLSRFCHARLEEAEKRIEILNERGEVKPAPPGFGAESNGRLEGQGVKTAEGLAEYLDARRAEVEATLGTNSAHTARMLRTSSTRRCATACWPAASGCARSSAWRAPTPLGASACIAMPAACAIELIHTYSLIHDDLPAMDNDTMRRGRPTLHVVAGEGMAILAGDGLLTEAFHLLAREPASRDPLVAVRKLRVIETVARAAGVVGMVGGQAIDLASVTPDSTGQLPARSMLTALRSMHARKTGALIRASAVSGAIMGGGSDEQIAAIDRAAGEFGLAFQIVDDILDVEGVATTLGKTAGKDAAAGKPTYPALYGLDTSRRMAAECLERAESCSSRGRNRRRSLARDRQMDRQSVELDACQC